MERGQSTQSANNRTTPKEGDGDKELISDDENQDMEEIILTDDEEEEDNEDLQDGKAIVPRMLNASPQVKYRWICEEGSNFLNTSTQGQGQ